MSIPPELTNLFLGLFGLGGGVLGTVLVRRGKREDVRLAEKEQTFDQVIEINESLRTENTRLRGLLEKAEAEKDRIRTSWEQRWERQMVRCRAVTEALVRAIAALRKLIGSDAAAEADDVMRLLEEHNQDDHPDPAPTT